MRTAITLVSLATLSSLSACGEKCADGSSPVNDECPCEDGTYPVDNGGTCDVALDCDIGEVESNGECRFECPGGGLADDEADCPVNLNPVAVGFEFVGVWDGTNLTGASFEDDDGEVVTNPPLVLVTLADLDFFSEADDELQETLHSCEFFSGFAVIAGTSELIPTEHGDVVWTQFDTSLSMFQGEWDFDETSCATKMDSDIWGEDGADLLTAFSTIHFAIGFGPLTDGLAEPYQDDDGNWDDDQTAEASINFFAQHIAINNSAGEFVFDDWTLGRAYEWDETTGEVLADEDNFLIPIDLTGVSELPPSYILSFAQWYEDFPLMDLTNLGDGRPVEGPTR